jgi:hypothetical protein
MRHYQETLWLEESLAVLVQLSQRRSSELYERNGFPIPDADRRLKGTAALRLTSGSISPARFKTLIDKVRRGTGLE